MNKEQQHIAWVDLLRVVACFLVVLAHSCDPYVGKPDEFLSGACWGSLVRCSVPLFVMISGVLLLPFNMETGAFYSRRMKRIIVPLIFWSLVTPLLYFLYISFAPATLNPGIVADQYTWGATLTKIYTLFFNFNYTTTPLWYIYMLIGLYLFLPIIGVWLNAASQKDIKRFLMIWGVTLLLPYLQMIAPALGYEGNWGDTGLLGVCTWNQYGTFYYFSGFLGYIVLAHYLVKFPLKWSWKRTLGTAVPLFLIGYAITLTGFLITPKLYPGDMAKLEIFWFFSGFNVFLMTISVFIVMQKLKVPHSPLLSKVAALTFGVYLCHFLLVQAGYDLVYSNVGLPAFLQIPLVAIIAFSAALFVSWLLSLSRWGRKTIM